jgi:hypothetical protein
LTGKNKHVIVIVTKKETKMAKSKLLRAFKSKKVNEVQAELSRAHLIIALLSFVAIVLLVQQAALLPALDSLMTTSAIILLSVLATISLTIALMLRSMRK